MNWVAGFLEDVEVGLLIIAGTMSYIVGATLAVAQQRAGASPAPTTCGNPRRGGVCANVLGIEKS